MTHREVRCVFVSVCVRVHVHVRVCAPHLHYLRAAMADDVLLAGVYDRDLDQSAGLPVAT